MLLQVFPDERATDNPSNPTGNQMTEDSVCDFVAIRAANRARHQANPPSFQASLSSMERQRNFRRERLRDCPVWSLVLEDPATQTPEFLNALRDYIAAEDPPPVASPLYNALPPRQQAI